MGRGGGREVGKRNKTRNLIPIYGVQIKSGSRSSDFLDLFREEFDTRIDFGIEFLFLLAATGTRWCWMLLLE